MREKEKEREREREKKKREGRAFACVHCIQTRSFLVSVT